MSVKLRGATTRRVAGWSGGLVEGAEPSVAHPQPYGSLASGLNLLTAPFGRLAVRGGSKVRQTFALDDVSEVLGVWPFSPVGAVAIAFDATADEHYAYALTDSLGWALGSPATETDSRATLTDWDTATPGRPVAVELFETLYVTDASTGTRRPLLALTVVAGVLTVTVPTYELAGGGAESATPYCASVYNSALFAAGWDSEAAPDAPHMLRVSLLGTDPANSAGFAADGYAILGAQGQRITALCPGRDVLLVAKANEIYRVFGTGQGLDGWFYSVQQVENTQGCGVTNPYALIHVNGYWYGIGSSGPFRTDGLTVEPLGIPWRESWARMARIDLAWVAYSPDPSRRKVWFGFYEQGVGAVEAPNTIWPWDLDRETWSPPMQFPRPLHLVGTVVPGSTEGPSGAPTALAQRFGLGDWGFTSLAVRWTSPDLTALTEVWARTDAGSFTLHTVVPAGVQRAHLTATLGARLLVKVRHVKEGVTGPFTGTVACYPRVPAPGLTLSSLGDLAPSVVSAQVHNFVAGASLIVQPATVAWQEQEDDLPVGVFAVDGISSTACTVVAIPDQGATIQTQADHPDWPLGFSTSRVEEMVTHQVGCSIRANTTGPTVRQLLEQGGMAPTSITVRFHPQAGAVTVIRTYRIDYRLASDVAWTSHSSVVIAAVPHETQSVTIGGLTPGRKYHVRCQIVELIGTSSYDDGAAVDCWTALPVPTQTVQVLGVGTPLVRLTLTAPYNGAGIVSWNADESYSATYAAQPGTPVAYDTTEGTCGVADRFFARTYDPTWPDGFQYSDLVTDDIASPCT